MIVIGAVFLVLAVLGAVAAVVTGRDVDVRLDGFGVHSTTTVLWVFCAGALAMLFLMLALGAFRRAARRRRAQRRELKQLRAEESMAAESRAAHRDEPLDVRDSDPNSDPNSDAVRPGESQTVPVDGGRERRYVAGDDRG